MVRFEIYPKLPLFMGKFSFFRIFYGKKLYGKLFSVPVNCSLRKGPGGTSSPPAPTQMILTNLSLRVEIPSRLGHHLISGKSTKSNHTSIKLAVNFSQRP